MIEQFHWIRPAWLIGVPLALIVWWWMRRRGIGAVSPWHRWVDPELHTAVIGAGETSTRAPGNWIALVAALLAVTALAGPSWERVSLPVQRGDDALVIALDLSRSMDATDVAPSRLARARLKLLDILAERKDGETALVVFSANAFVVSPLTSDGGTVASQVLALDSNLMPTRGSYPESGITKALQLLQQAEVQRGAVLLITDGGNLDPAVEAAEAFADAGHTLSVLGVGTLEGGPIPEPRGGFVTDTRGTIALPKLDARGLGRLASAGRGRFVSMSNNNDDIEKLGLSAGARQSASSARESDRLEIERWRDLGPWVLVLSLPLIAWSVRRHLVFAPLLVFLVFLPQPVLAWSPADWFMTSDQRGQRALAQGDAERAASLFADPDWKATAAYRAGDFTGSAQLWAESDGADGLYNRGTALAQSGQINEAISALRAAVELDPSHEDAQHNLHLLESLQNASDQQSGAGQSSEDSSESESDQNEQGQNDAEAAGQSAGETTEQQSADGNAQPQPSPDRPPNEQEATDIAELMQALREAEMNGDDEAREQAAAALREAQESQESEQSLQQWLRRVPDDPGGLLRAKFRRQYQRRRTDQDGNMLWPDDRGEPW
ncbi:MAG: VWA domain-containing protein [Pseudomonadota bacterium]